ncbi:DUF6292 family protein [Crossiella sp. NPDC003009]
MELRFEEDDEPVRAARHYLRRVAAALGLRGDCLCVEQERPVSVYLPLEERLPDFPGRDVALLWAEDRGWAVAVETRCGADLEVVARLDGEHRPPPRAVAGWVRRLCHNGATFPATRAGGAAAR